MWLIGHMTEQCLLLICGFDSALMDKLHQSVSILRELCVCVYLIVIYAIL